MSGRALQPIHPAVVLFSLPPHKVRAAAAEKLVHELDEYYGGKDRASAMLAGSWQAQWMLGEDFEFLDGGGMRGYGAAEEDPDGADDDDDGAGDDDYEYDDDDDDDDGGGADDDDAEEGERRMQRYLGNNRKKDKKAKKAAAKLARLDPTLQVSERRTRRRRGPRRARSSSIPTT